MNNYLNSNSKDYEVKRYDDSLHVIKNEDKEMFTANQKQILNSLKNFDSSLIKIDRDIDIQFLKKKRQSNSNSQIPDYLNGKNLPNIDYTVHQTNKYVAKGNFWLNQNSKLH